MAVKVADHVSPQRERVKISDVIATTCLIGSSLKEAVCQAIKNLHHVVSLAVIVMCLMLKCMMTSKMEIQAHTLVWSVSFLVLVMFTFCGHFVIYSDKKHTPKERCVRAVALRLRQNVGSVFCGPKVQSDGEVFGINNQKITITFFRFFALKLLR